MNERWVKHSGEFTYIYDIRRVHNTATLRIIAPNGDVRKSVSADRDLLDGKLSETELMAKGYQRT